LGIYVGKLVNDDAIKVDASEPFVGFPGVESDGCLVRKGNLQVGLVDLYLWYLEGELLQVAPSDVFGLISSRSKVGIPQGWAFTLIGKCVFKKVLDAAKGLATPSMDNKTSPSLLALQVS
jgi:hypothetical protein